MARPFFLQNNKINTMKSMDLDLKSRQLELEFGEDSPTLPSSGL